MIHQRAGKKKNNGHASAYLPNKDSPSLARRGGDIVSRVLVVSSLSRWRGNSRELFLRLR